MEKITTASRIHPLMAAAALSVITVSAVGTAAITGLLPTSKAEKVVAVAPAQQLLEAQKLLASQQLAAAPAIATAQPEAQAEPAPKPRAKPAPRPRRVVARAEPRTAYAPQYQHQAQAAAPERKPNYVGIGAGAVIGGLLGNQVGGGNGKKLATVAGIIGGGYLGNEVANRYQQR
jgi:uncharacterized protein YcfJ